MRPSRRHYLTVRRWIDAKLSSPSRRTQELAFWPAGVPWLPIAFFRVSEVAVWGPCAAFSVAWTAFCCWRAYRLIRTSGIKSARHYDRVGKHQIPPEYARSESYLAHQKRGRAGQIE